MQKTDFYLTCFPCAPYIFFSFLSSSHSNRITFCGITMKNYVESNISQKSHTTIKYALKMMSSSSETIIFMFLGVATVNNRHDWNTCFVVLTIIFCSVYRTIGELMNGISCTHVLQVTYTFLLIASSIIFFFSGIIILSAIANRFRLNKLSRVDQFVMSYGGKCVNAFEKTV